MLNCVELWHLLNGMHGLTWLEARMVLVRLSTLAQTLTLVYMQVVFERSEFVCSIGALVSLLDNQMTSKKCSKLLDIDGESDIDSDIVFASIVDAILVDVDIGSKKETKLKEK